MEILQHEEEETFIILIKLDQRQKNIKECIALSLAATTHLINHLLINNSRVVALVVLIYNDGSIYPYSKTIEEITLLFCQFFLTFRVDNIVWLVLAKSKFLAIHITQQYFRKNKHAVS